MIANRQKTYNNSVYSIECALISSQLVEWFGKNSCAAIQQSIGFRIGKYKYDQKREGYDIAETSAVGIFTTIHDEYTRIIRTRIRVTCRVFGRFPVVSVNGFKRVCIYNDSRSSRRIIVPVWRNPRVQNNFESNYDDWRPLTSEKRTIDLPYTECHADCWPRQNTSLLSVRSFYLTAGPILVYFTSTIRGV